MGRRDVDALGLGRADDLVDRRASDEHVGHRDLDGVEVDPEAGRQVRLRVDVDAQDPQAVLASAPARLIAVVVLPTPPFWLAIAITFVTGASPRSSRWRLGSVGASTAGP